MASADALLAFMSDHISAVVLAACPRLKIIACALKGFDNVDVEACTAAEVWVTIFAGSSHQSDGGACRRAGHWARAATSRGRRAHALGAVRRLATDPLRHGT